jgi:hypothetical protein
MYNHGKNERPTREISKTVSAFISQPWKAVILCEFMYGGKEETKGNFIKTFWQKNYTVIRHILYLFYIIFVIFNAFDPIDRNFPDIINLASSHYSLLALWLMLISDSVPSMLILLQLSRICWSISFLTHVTADGCSEECVICNTRPSFFESFHPFLNFTLAKAATEVPSFHKFHQFSYFPTANMVSQFFYWCIESIKQPC